MNESMKIYDGGTEKTAKNWNGYHPLFTAAARRGVLFESVKIWMLVGFVVGTGAGIALDVGPASVLIGLSMVVVVWFGMRDDVYKKVYGPDHDRGRLNLPEGMSWEDAVERIRCGFANPDVEQVTDTPDAITFYSKKRGTYQLQNTADGLKMTILSTPSKSSKKAYLYAVFSSVLLSQVIALLYPQMISAGQVEEEKAAVQKLFKAYKRPFLLELVLAAVLLVFMGITLYKVLYSDSVRSKGVSDSYLEAFPSGVTVGEVLDDFFADGKWDNYEQNGVTYVSYTGTGENTQTGEKIVICFYFKINSDKTAKIDRITWNGDTMNTLEQLSVISALNDNYRESHGLASSNALDSAFDELENALNGAFADSESEAESVSDAELESESYAEGTNWDDSYGDTDYDNLYVRIQSDSSCYWDWPNGGVDNDERAYLLSLGEQNFYTIWESAMIGDMSLMASRYDDYESGYESFQNYILFYLDIYPHGNLADKYVKFYQENGAPENAEQAEIWVNDITGELYNDPTVPLDSTASRQEILVEATGSNATLTLWTYRDGQWIEDMSTTAAIGSNGLTTNKTEGDHMTPEGTFPVYFAFSTKAKNTKIDFETISEDSVWVCDPESIYYNTLQSKNNLDKDWADKSGAENMYPKFSKGSSNACICFGFNGDGESAYSATPYAGSALFIDGVGENGNMNSGYGDIKISGVDMTKLLSYLDSDYNPTITIQAAQ